MTAVTLESLVQDAISGDGHALESVLRRIKADIYGLSLRMLVHPADAEDATQEILFRIVTRLSTFEGRSSFRTWVYRVSVRALLNVRRGRAEPEALSFDEFGADLLNGLTVEAPDGWSDAEQTRLTNEIRISCTQAMLLCLDRAHRIAYLLGVIFELDGETASQCLEITPAAYRKRLSRARARVERFTRASCGLANPRAPCSCAGRIEPALASGRLDPVAMLFSEHPALSAPHRDAELLAATLGNICRSDELMRSNPRYVAPDRLLKHVRDACSTSVRETRPTSDPH